MDVTFTSEQNDLRDAVRGLLTRGYGESERRRKVVASDPGFDETTWRQLAEMGVLGLPFAEEDGGMGAGPVEVAIVAEEFGRVIAPEPFVAAVVLAGGLVDAVGSAEQKAEVLSGLAEGRILPAFAHEERGTRWGPCVSAVTATQDGGTWRLTGVKEPVPDGARADVLVASAAIDGDTRLFLVRAGAEGLTRDGHRTHDGGRAAKITFAGTPAEALGDGPAEAAIERAQALARVAFAHEAVGAMSTALALTTAYLKTRKQFGVTLNTFQALTFRTADMYVSLELARSTALWATLVADAGGDVGTAADRARLQASRASRHIGKEAIQLHGGIGMTAEYAVGHYTSRLTALDHVLGDGDWALARLARNLGDHTVLDPLA